MSTIQEVHKRSLCWISIFKKQLEIYHVSYHEVMFVKIQPFAFSDMKHNSVISKVGTLILKFFKMLNKIHPDPSSHATHLIQDKETRLCLHI